MSIDRFLSRRFHIRRYNCWHFTREVWLDLTGQDLGDLTPEDISGQALAERVRQEVPAFTRLAEPEEPCLVLMLRPRDVPHIAVYTQGRVLQITALGVTFLPVQEAQAGYQSVRFYRAANRNCPRSPDPE